MSLITISQGIGTEGVKIAKQVASGLNLKLYDDITLKEQALKMGIRPDGVKSFDEKLPGFFERIWGHSPTLYVDLMEAVVYEVAKTGKGVIVGHGSNILLREFDCALHVLIYAPRAWRVQHLSEAQGLSREAAEKLVRKHDHERAGFLKYAFKMDWDDPSQYDLTINSIKLGAETAAKLIIETAKSQEILECSLTASDAMGRLMLLKRIEAALLENNFTLSYLHVEVPESGVAYVRGFINSVEEKRSLKDVVQRIPGISKTTVDVAVIPPGA